MMLAMICLTETQGEGNQSRNISKSQRPGAHTTFYYLAGFGALLQHCFLMMPPSLSVMKCVWT